MTNCNNRRDLALKAEKKVFFSRQSSISALLSSFFLLFSYSNRFPLPVRKIFTSIRHPHPGDRQQGNREYEKDSQEKLTAKEKEISNIQISLKV